LISAGNISPSVSWRIFISRERIQAGLRELPAVGIAD
jgi:hypothetical protein